MKKKYCLIYLCVFYFMNTGYTQVLQKRDSVRKYYELVNAAELAIIDANYQLALLHYNEAGNYKWLNADDLFNAGIVAYLSNDTVQSIHYLNLLASFGLKKSEFEETVWGRTIWKSDFYQFIAKDYHLIYEKSKESSKTYYGQKMKSFYEKDQSVREMIVDGNGRPIAPVPDNPNRGKSDHENALEMLKYIDQYGFPSFAQTGFYDEHRNDVPSGTYYYLWVHRCPDTTLVAVTHKAVLDGDFPPGDYAVSLEMCGDSGGKMEYLTYYFQEVSGYSEEEIQAIDKKRSSIYLEPLRDYMKKFKYYEKDSRFKLLNIFIYGLHKVSELNIEE